MPNDFDKGLKIGTFDIETLDLSAQWSYTVCACIKEVNKDNLRGRIHTFRIDDYNYKRDQDKGLVNDLISTLNSFDLLIGWYSSRFDFPFIATRAMKHKLVPPVRKFRRDLCLAARGFGRLNNNRLATWDRWLNGEALKTGLTFEHKLGVIRGEKRSVDYYVDHCERDVISTEKVYKSFVEGGLLGKLRKA